MEITVMFLRKIGRYGFHLFAFLMVVYFTLPMIIAVMMSFTPSRFLRLPTTEWSTQWYYAFFSDPKWMEGLTNSMIVAGITIVISMVVGLTAAMAFTRYKFKWNTTLYTLALTPVFTPAVIIAMSLLTVAYKTGMWGGYTIIAIAHALWAFPLVIMVLRVGLEGLDRSLEEAARGMGASPIRVFYEIILPLIGPSILVGALFAFIISINEFIMALFLGTSETETLPRIVYPTLRYRLTPVVAAASGILMLLTVSVLLLAARLMNLRKMVSYNRSN
jgi:ABC-type spermidine/putrescine transport system permease subunit II